ncbi:hypothetical protein EG14_00485 [Porphyromonas gingivalis]|nr:hypothetical protein EG14_00485 [Porphyromonas gingivalis]
MRYFGTLYVFTLSQKKESGGYDAAVVYGSKKLNTTQEVTKKIKRYTRTESGHRAGAQGMVIFPLMGISCAKSYIFVMNQSAWKDL